MIVHLSTFNRFDYRIGVPGGRAAYEPWANPNVVGNGGGVFADGQAMHGFGYSAEFVLAANSILVFAR
jgi:1,4-alpha-glucan branching enzyme